MKTHFDDLYPDAQLPAAERLAKGDKLLSDLDLARMLPGREGQPHLSARALRERRAGDPLFPVPLRMGGGANMTWRSDFTRYLDYLQRDAERERREDAIIDLDERLEQLTAEQRKAAAQLRAEFMSASGERIRDALQAYSDFLDQVLGRVSLRERAVTQKREPSHA